MQPTDGDLSTAPGADTPSGRPQLMISVPVSRLRQHIMLSAIVAVLAFTLFVLTFVWDQNHWMAAFALPIGCLATGYALWCGRALSTSR